MAKAKRVRWDCPTGKHPGVLASTRPARDAIVRYCLKCSEETGKLTERIAPALERKRAAAAESAAVKAKAKRARAAVAKAKKKADEDARYTVEGVDLRVEMKKLLKLRAFGGPTSRLATRPPEFIISRRTSEPTSRYGYANPWENKISICTWPGQSLASVRETLVHELTHIVVGHKRSEGWHGTTFRETLRKAFYEAYKVRPAGLPGNVYHGRYAAALARKQKEGTA